MSEEYIGDVYEDEDGGFMRVTGVIYDPAVILKNPISGKKDVRVIKSNHFKNMKQLSQKDALEICLQNLGNKSIFEEKYIEVVDKYEAVVKKYELLVDKYTKSICGD